MDAGGTVRPPAKKYATIKRRLQTLKEKFQDGRIELMTYADYASELLHLGQWHVDYFRSNAK